MGSVKDIDILKNTNKNDFGIARFTFSDRYSVFDWGEMPDHIPNKGSAIAILGAHFFEKLQETGIANHYLGMVENGKAKKLCDLKKPLNTMEVKLLNVVKPKVTDIQYDYSVYKDKHGGFLIPLEIIYRNYLPEGSSVFNRLKKEALKLDQLCLDKTPESGQKLETPFNDVSTKLEITDRYLNWLDARSMVGLSGGDVLELHEIIDQINDIITKEVEKIKLINEDGKIELGFDFQRQFMVVDVIGTLDECRFTYFGIPVSKEIARIYYRNTEWHKAVEEAKKENRTSWKDICKLKPNKLPKRLKNAITNIYCACTNEITERKWFKDTPSLNECVKEIKPFLK